MYCKLYLYIFSTLWKTTVVYFSTCVTLSGCAIPVLEYQIRLIFQAVTVSVCFVTWDFSLSVTSFPVLLIFTNFFTTSHNSST